MGLYMAYRDIWGYIGLKGYMGLYRICRDVWGCIGLRGSLGVFVARAF